MQPFNITAIICIHAGGVSLGMLVCQSTASTVSQSCQRGRITPHSLCLFGVPIPYHYWPSQKSRSCSWWWSSCLFTRQQHPQVFHHVRNILKISCFPSNSQTVIQIPRVLSNQEIKRHNILLAGVRGGRFFFLWTEPGFMLS